MYYYVGSNPPELLVDPLLCVGLLSVINNFELSYNSQVIHFITDQLQV